MTFLPKSAWRYAVLIIVLFAIVAVASATIISYLQDQISEQPAAETIRQLSVAIWALTMGCMFLAGALGLWAIRSTAEIEGRRRIGRFVDTMDYLRDGLLAIDSDGHVRGSNPAARRLAPHSLTARKAIVLSEIFACLTRQDMDQLLDPLQPYEIERDCVYTHGLRTLRFRSQPSEGLMLVLVSDITSHRSREIHKRQIAQLQIVGRIAAGVAHDFNNILCSISGHVTLLQRFGLDPETMKRSLVVIAEETQKGEVLSRQLLELSRSGAEGKPSEDLAGNVTEAAGLLRTALSTEWTVQTLINGKYPAVPLTHVQVEQVVLNLGLLAADAQAQPGTVTISLNRPGQGRLLDVGEQYAAVILISGESTPQTEESLTVQAALPVSDEGGVISSVVRTMVEEARGHLDQLSAIGGLCIYRVCLPHLDTRADLEAAGRLSAEQIEQSLSRWRVMLAGEGRELDMLETSLAGIGAGIDRKSNVASILAGVERYREYDVLVIDKGILGRDARNILKALRELCPHLGIIIYGLAQKHSPWPEALGVVCVLHVSGFEDWLRPLIHARSAAIQAVNK